MIYSKKMELIIFIIGISFIIGTDSTNAQSGQHHIHKRSPKPLCLDKYAAIPDHTMCLANIKSHPLNDTRRDAIVNKHNELRGRVSPTATNMLKMSYSKILENESQIWAEQCKSTHDQNIQRFQPGLYPVGQNIASSKLWISWEEVIQLWFDEYKLFTYGNKNYEFHKIGHYTQVAWASTSLVGCGVHRCGDYHYYVCNYGPAGNMGSLERPYKNGTSCADCPGHCDKKMNLCDCGSQVCLNDGQLDPATCKCSCNQKVKHYDTNQCDLYCDKDGDNPLCGIYPFDKKSCPTNGAAPLNCPWLCDICPYAGKNYTEGSVPLPSSRASQFGMELFSTVIMTAFMGLLKH